MSKNIKKRNVQSDLIDEQQVNAVKSPAKTKSPPGGPITPPRRLLQQVSVKSFLFFIAGVLANGFFLLLLFGLPPTPEWLELEPSSAISKNTPNGSRHKLAIVVPFRDRFDELKQFVPHMFTFLQLSSLDFKIYIINQVDDFRFNRASLINVGFLASMSECDYMAMHDVDLLPLDQTKLSYAYPSHNGPYHVSAPGLHPEYNYTKFIGGILIVRREDFLATNGMSTRYWGWGKEDDEFYLRLQEANLTVQRPNVSAFGAREHAFWHNHDANRRVRDRRRFLKQKKESLQRDTTGLSNIQYRVVSIEEIHIETYPCTIVDVMLFCDKSDTHWCNYEYQFYD
jgi:xylosylprotein 4-beta-galactosyltransferase